MRSWVLMFLLLLSILIHDAQGIRLRKGSLQLQALEQQSIHEKVSSNEGGIDECKSKKCSSGKMKRKLTRVQKEHHHWLPRIHEDYYGPRLHRPKHH
ncbi:hypothetical protein ACS0TY_024659 [Phlomoides rotata]